MPGLADRAALGFEHFREDNVTRSSVVRASSDPRLGAGEPATVTDVVQRACPDNVNAAVVAQKREQRSTASWVATSPGDSEAGGARHRIARLDQLRQPGKRRKVAGLGVLQDAAKTTQGSATPRSWGPSKSRGAAHASGWPSPSLKECAAGQEFGMVLLSMAVFFRQLVSALQSLGEFPIPLALVGPRVPSRFWHSGDRSLDLVRFPVRSGSRRRPAVPGGPPVLRPASIAVRASAPGSPSTPCRSCPFHPGR